MRATFTTRLLPGRHYNDAVLEELREQFLAAQLAGDRREALRVVVEKGLQGANLAATELAVGVVAEAQRKIGELWQRNRISVADEHMATAIAQDLHFTDSAHFTKSFQRYFGRSPNEYRSHFAFNPAWLRSH